MKECRRCGQVAEILRGRAICRACKAADDRAYHLANRERQLARMRQYSKTYQPSESVLEYQREYRREHAARYIEHSRRRRALLRGVPVMELTPDQIQAKIAYWGGRCWMCGTPDIKDMDHVKPVTAGGAHILANLRPSCMSCNRSKGAKWPYERLTYRPRAGV